MASQQRAGSGNRSRRLCRLAYACCLLWGAGQALLAQDDPWLPASLVDQSELLRPAALMDSPGLVVRGQTPAEAPADLLQGLEAVANTPAEETVFNETVTSLTLSPSTVGKTPAAVFVIDQEMIRRSGAQTVPDLLRMVPGVHVGIGNGLAPNVTIRGVGASNRLPFSTRILVLIDGRSIYEPTSGGVSWIRNDLVLQDIERIEVIRGPGATVWGANAVNGVINIVTKSAEDTQGTLAQGLGGSYYHSITVLRHGAKVGDDAYLRVYGKFRDFDDQFRDPTDAANSIPFPGSPANDSFHDFQAGFRYDNQLNEDDQLSVQGRIAGLPAGDATTVPGPSNVLVAPLPAGYFVGSVQSSWTRTFDTDSDLKLLAIYDRADAALSFGQFTRDSYILDAAYRWRWRERHRLLAGAQFRLDRDTIADINYTTFDIHFDPASRTYNVVSWLIQDDIELVPDDLSLLIGTKMEVNPFTGFEIQPSARLLKTLDDQRVAWAAVSRAIRRPNRIDEHNDSNTHLPLLPAFQLSQVLGNPNLKADAAVSFELGYRAEPVDWFSWDVATFCTLYSDLPTYPSRINGLPVETQVINGGSAESYGAEWSATVDMTETWKITGAYSLLAVFAHVDQPPEGVNNPIDERFLYEGGSPNNMVYLRSSWSPSKSWDVDLIGRYVDKVAYGSIPPYIETDLRLAWRPRERLELAVMGLNLLDSSHAEYETREFVAFNPIRTQVPRSVYGSITYSY